MIDVNTGYFRTTADDIEAAVLELLEPYNNQDFLMSNSEIRVRRTANNPCEALHDMDLQCYQPLFHNIQFYTVTTVCITNQVLNRVNQLAIILSGLAINVFKIQASVMKIYGDGNEEDSRKMIICLTLLRYTSPFSAVFISSN